MDLDRYMMDFGFKLDNW